MKIVKNAEELRDPFLCFCLIMKFMEEAGEDYVDYNESIVAPWTFAMWMYGKGYIDSEVIETLAKIDVECLSLADVMMDEYLFPNSYGSNGFANAKIYSIFAEYLSGLSEFRQKLYESVNDKAYGFEDYEFYKNADGISLACIINDEDMIENPKYSICKITKEINPYILSLKDLYNLRKRMTIKDADLLSIEDDEDDE